MKCYIRHESTGRIRVHMAMDSLSIQQADILEYYLKNIAGIDAAKVYDRTADVVIRYSCDRAAVLQALAVFTFQNPDLEELVPENTGREENKKYEEQLVTTVVAHVMKRLFVPLPIRGIVNIVKSVEYIYKGLKSLAHRKIEVSMLDAVAITVSLIRRDYNTAGSVMYLLRIGEILEEWTHKKSVSDLARNMSLKVDKAWTKCNGVEVLLPIRQIRSGDIVVLRAGSMIPLDGYVISGDATVNQASMTGESEPVHKEKGGYVYAGTVVEEGQCEIKVDNVAGKGRYDRIVKMIEESEKLKSAAESRATHLADRLVPYTLGGALLTYLLTRNVTKAISVLMVDFSCALKLAMPITVLSAMREANDYGISVKGGKYLEAIAEADTIVFDKTGTLTYATPKVTEVIAFGGNDPDEMLRLAACLEEHYPHSMATAVVNAAQEKDLNHEERHSKVEYVVAHGISSSIDGQKAIIGSYHFIFEDSECTVPEGEEAKLKSISDEYSHLYMAIGNRLAAVICIEDPLRIEAKEVVEKLRLHHLSKVVIMTGDNKKIARRIARMVGVDEYYYEVLPEDKANFIRQEHAQGRKVIMVGDGVNDSPALSESDAGIAISDGAAIAREIADVTISADNLYTLITLKELSECLMKRIRANYRHIIEVNSALIVLGVAGIFTPATSALLHNASTIGISLYSMTDLIDARKEW